MASRYLRASGNWNGPVWAATESGAAGSAATPAANDSVYIQANFTVTLSGNAVAQQVYQTAGHINLSSYKLELSTALQSVGSTTRSINLGSGVLETNVNMLQANGSMFAITGSNCTLTAGSSTVILNCGYMHVTTSLETLSQPLNDVIINLGVGTPSNPVAIDIKGSPTFRSLIIQSKNSAAHTVNFDGGVGINIQNLVLIGSSEVSRLSISAPYTALLSFDSFGTIYGRYVSMNNISKDNLDFGGGTPGYIGSGSVVNNSADWILEDPPKLSTLIDEFNTLDTSRWATSVAGTGEVGVYNGVLSMGWMGGSSSYVAIDGLGTYYVLGEEWYIRVGEYSRPLVYVSIGDIWWPLEATFEDEYIYYRFNTTQEGLVTVSKYTGDGWSHVKSEQVDPLGLLAARVSISGNRNDIDGYTYIESVGVTPAPTSNGNFLMFF